MAQNSLTYLYEVWEELSKKRKRQIGLLFLLMLLSSFAEMMAIGAIFPFIASISAPNLLLKNEYVKYIASSFSIQSHKELIVLLAILFAISSLAAGLIRLSLMWFQTRLTGLIGTDFSVEIFRKTIYQPYSKHINSNSSEIIAAITNKCNSLVDSAIYPLLVLFSSALISFTIMITLFIINGKIALLSFIGFGLIYYLILLSVRKSMFKFSSIINIESVRIFEIVQECIGGIRDVILGRTHKIFIEHLYASERLLRLSSAQVQFLGGAPRYIVESLGMTLVAGVSLFMVISNPVDNEMGLHVLPTIGALALGAQRLLPLFQQGYSAIISIHAGKSSVKDALAYLKIPLKDEWESRGSEKISFKRRIVFENVAFKFARSGIDILGRINLEIPKGSKVGIVGSSGSGKSTFLDLLMGLLVCTEGSITIDDRPLTGKYISAWQEILSHVPQTIYLSNKSLKENIAFGISKTLIDDQRVAQVIKMAALNEVIDSLEDGYNTKVGERGVRLSGGQRQRIGLARALYQTSEIIVLDEATSALDTETEARVMESIYSLGKEITIFIVAHRLSTLKECDFIVEIMGAKGIKIITYHELTNKT